MEKGKEPSAGLDLQKLWDEKSYGKAADEIRKNVDPLWGTGITDLKLFEVSYSYIEKRDGWVKLAAKSLKDARKQFDHLTGNYLEGDDHEIDDIYEIEDEEPSNDHLKRYGVDL